MLEYSSKTSHFYIKYNKEHFMRLSVEGGLYQDKTKVLASLGLAITKMEENKKIEMPIAFYNTRGDGEVIPYLEWSLDEKKWIGI